MRRQLALALAMLLSMPTFAQAQATRWRIDNLSATTSSTFGLFDPAISYSQGAFVTTVSPKSGLFIAILAFTPGDAGPFDPCTPPACKWAAIGTSALIWDTTHAYKQGELAQYLGGLWSAITANIGIAPDTSVGVNWSPVAVNNSPVWNSTQPYRTGDIVVVGTTVYVANAPNTSQMPPSGSWTVVGGGGGTVLGSGTLGQLGVWVGTNTIGGFTGLTYNDAIKAFTLGTGTSLLSDLGPPTTLTDGMWWVECAGTSPTRTCAINVRDGGSTHAIATITY